MQNRVLDTHRVVAGQYRTDGGAGGARQADGRFGPLTAEDREPLGSPHAPNGLRYLSLVTLPDGRQRMYYESTRADGAHDLRTELA